MKSAHLSLQVLELHQQRVTLLQHISDHNLTTNTTPVHSTAMHHKPIVFLPAAELTTKFTQVAILTFFPTGTSCLMDYREIWHNGGNRDHCAKFHIEGPYLGTCVQKIQITVKISKPFCPTRKKIPHSISEKYIGFVQVSCLYNSSNLVHFVL